MLATEQSKLTAEEKEHKKHEAEVAIEAKEAAMKQAAADLKFANNKRIEAEKKAADELKSINDMKQKLALMNDYKRSEAVEKELKIKETNQAKTAEAAHKAEQEVVTTHKVT
jgi:hypothetical protein